VSRHRRGGRASPDQLRAGLAARLQARRDEIEQTILTRVYSVSDPTDPGDPAYVTGLRAAVSSALGYGLAGIERGNAEPGPIPVELFAQARLAARSGISLDTVLRRYFAGYTLLGDFVMQEAEKSDLFDIEEMQALSKTQAMLVDRLVSAISAEYQREAKDGSSSSEQRRADCVRRLLAGELADSSVLGYDLSGWHLAAIAVGPEAEQAIHDLANAVDRRLLIVRPDEEAVWAWFGGVRKLAAQELESLAVSGPSARASVVVGQQGQGPSGWRLTHRQARAALPIARRGSPSLTRYADVALLASMLQDDLLLAHLRESCLAPLAQEHDGGATLRETLRAYFAAGGNTSSAAAALKVSRQTVTNRLRAVDERLGRPLASCAAEMEAALRLQEMDLQTAKP
jgi:hypothetical protein